MKKVFLSVIFIFGICLTSCLEDTTQSAKNEFSKYYNGKDEVVLVYDNVIYMEKTNLDLKGLVNDNEPNNGIIIKQNTLFFSASVQNSMFDYSLNIYESNFLGTEIELVFSKNGFKTHPWAYAVNDYFYIEHYKNNALDAGSKQIDKYTISTGNYEIVDNGNNCSLSNYFQEEHSRYSIEIKNTSAQEHEKFIITDLETGLEKIIDDNYLKNTKYIKSMEMFNYWPKRFDISNGHILLTYGLKAGDGWNSPHLVFEYDFEKDELEYKLLAFPYDNVPVEIIYMY